MIRFAALGALCLALGGCVYYPYGYGYGYGYAPRYGYAPPAYGYPAPAYPYGAYPTPPANGYPRTLGPNGDNARRDRRLMASSYT